MDPVNRVKEQLNKRHRVCLILFAVSGNSQFGCLGKSKRMGNFVDHPKYSPRI